MSVRRMIRAGAGCGADRALTPANAAPPGPRDPDWPCQQIKVPELSLAAVWTGPAVDPQNTDWQHDQAVADLVHEIVQRRVPLAQAQDKIQTFAQQANDQKQPKLLELIGRRVQRAGCGACCRHRRIGSVRRAPEGACRRGPRGHRQSCGSCRRTPMLMPARSTSSCSGSPGKRRSSRIGGRR